MTSWGFRASHLHDAGGIGVATKQGILGLEATPHRFVGLLAYKKGSGAPISAGADKGEEEEEAAGDEGMASSSDDIPTAFVLQMRVSGGTYVRLIVHDLMHVLGSAGHVIMLTRSRQKDYVLEPTEEGDHGCVLWEVFEAALKDAGEKDADVWTAWERKVLDKLVVVSAMTLCSPSPAYRARLAAGPALIRVPHYERHRGDGTVRRNWRMVRYCGFKYGR
jgi:hypothetical protein